MLAFTLLALSSGLGLLPGVSGFGLHQTSTGLASSSRKLARFRPPKLKMYRAHDESIARHELDYGDTLHSFIKNKERNVVSEEVYTIEQLLSNPPSGFFSVAATAATSENENEVGSIFDQIKASSNGPVPATTSVVVIDSMEDLQNPDMMDQLKDIQLLASYINAYAAKRVYDDRKGKPFNLDNEEDALDFTVQFANSINYVITKGMATYLHLETAGTSVLKKTTTGATVNADILKSLFGSLALPAEALGELTGLIGEVAGKLDVSLEKIAAPIKHLITYYYFEPVIGLEEVKVAKMRFYYLSVSQTSWNKKFCGIASTNKFDFDMIQVNTETEMNFELVERNREQIVSLIEQIAQTNLDDVSEAISPKIIKKS